MNWAWQVFTLEIRKILSYRVDFWINFLGQLFASAGIGYFLWKAIFESQGITEMRGFDLQGMVLYYLLVPVTQRIVQGVERGGLSGEIYEGTLNRYLVYPVPFFMFKYVAKAAFSVVSTLQYILVLGAFVFVLGHGSDRISISGAGMALLLAIFAGLIYFTLMGAIELVSFWADNVWSLIVMLRMTTNILSGAMIPIAFFPERAIAFLEWTPFPYFLSVPVELAMGRGSLERALNGFCVLAIWQCVFSLVFFLVWSRGLRKYSGVGI